MRPRSAPPLQEEKKRPGGFQHKKGARQELKQNTSKSLDSQLSGKEEKNLPG